MVSLSFQLSIMASLTFTIGIAITSNSPIFAKSTPSNRKLKQNYNFQDTYEDTLCKNPDVGFDIENGITSACCPPSSNKQVKEYEVVRPQVCRKRMPIHKVSSRYTIKFKLKNSTTPSCQYRSGTYNQRSLPCNDPRSFMNQAKLHCAYSQMTTELGVHNSWLFFPFHRWYLYFFERILGELISDPTFALPYWNWDNPDGREIPHLFEKGRNSNPLYDKYRNPNHHQPAIVDQDYTLEERNISRVEQIQINLSTINKQMIRNAQDTNSFFGGHEIGNYSISMGSIEAGCHNAIHLWVGDPRMPSMEDMGSVDSASFDPLFYPHHANIDRMWTLWREMDINQHHEPSEEQWRNASFVFYDEKGDPVRVYNKDCVNLQNLGYEYEESNTPWKELVLE